MHVKIIFMILENILRTNPALLLQIGNWNKNFVKTVNSLLRF